MSFVIRELRAEDLPLIAATDGGNGWHGDALRWQSRLAECQTGKRVVLLAFADGADGNVVGYGSLLWRSQYPPFVEESIPEIQDLVVAATHRGQGAGGQLVAALEGVAAKAGHKTIGIGVGLYRDYGPAQRLYVHLGYVPDGRGATHSNRSLPGGSETRLDDQLILWLVKQLA